jgi:two-component system chemotaxis response regulator CheY
MIEPRPTILVVDDDAFSAELAGLALEMGGFEALIAEGALDGLEKLAKDDSIRVIVSDLNMPLMDGQAFFLELRSQGFSQPFILLSSQGGAPVSGIAEVLPKDEHFQEALPRRVAALLAEARKG